MLSVLCRILERFIKNPVVEHLECHFFLSDHQHGFREKRSCLSNLLTNLDELTKLLDDGNMLDQVYLDFSKAFDKVPHQRLILKLQNIGVKGKLLSWIESFLTNRMQSVKVNGIRSFWSSVLSGVPQGSVLGPLLFILYVNDLPNCLTTCSCKIFADDTKIASKVNSCDQADLLQEDLNRLYEWTRTWKMQFNGKKCHVLHIGKTNPKYLYHINGCLVTPVHKEKDLGVVMTRDLKASSNVNECVKRANQTLGMIRRTFSYLDETSFVQLYKVFVRPQLEYCQQAVNPTSAHDINLVERVQRRATKLVPGLDGMEYESRLKALNLYSMDERRVRGDLIFMYRLMSGDVNIDPARLFKLNPHNLGDKESRLYNTLKVEPRSHPNLQIRHTFFTQRVVRPWNSLPEYVVRSENVSDFKTKYDQIKGLVV